MKYVGVLVLLVAACVDSETVQCLDGRTCPANKVCADIHSMCVLEDQLAQCEGVLDRDRCMAPTGPGTCQAGVCLEAGCGNGRLDAVEDEECDDGNETDGDECSADCRSNETCGNTVTDRINDEDCDDGNVLDHDGCTSSCKVEIATWSPAGAPSARATMAAALDTTRGTIVMFGGQEPGSTLPGETWEWNGIWRSIAVTLAPAPRTDAAMAYDQARREIVLLGGAFAQTPTGDTWTWDGAAWTARVEGPDRALHAMAYDARRQRVVTFGGYKRNPANPQFPLAAGDTWEWDGEKWSPTTGPQPPARVGAAMSYDAKRGVIVMFGGLSDAGTALADVWEYDGTWTNRTPAFGNPTPVYRPGLAWDATSENTLLFGGYDDSSAATQISATWNGTAWSATTPTRPEARGGHVLVADGRGRVLLFGGAADVSTYFPETVVFSGNAWVTLQAPSPRQYAQSAYDPLRRRTVVFGGFAGPLSNPPARDTWELTDAGWRLAHDGTGTAPPSLAGASMAFDSARDEVVLFGGGQSTPWELSVWTFKNGLWTESTTVPAPQPRYDGSMAYDAARAETLLFGGVTSTNERVGETWTWNGSTWTNRQPAAAPSARAGSAVGYDPIRQVVVLFGGDGKDDTWIWDGTTWHSVMTPVKPPPHRLGTLTWNASRGSLVLVGSMASFLDTWEWVGTTTSPPGGTWRLVATLRSPSPRQQIFASPTFEGGGIVIGYGTLRPSNTQTDELWTFRYSGAGGAEACQAAVDLDGDSLAGCADPDCWSICTPLCPPGAPCDPAAPRCGDGTCSSIETCSSCPNDCTCAPLCGDGRCDTGEACLGDCP